MTTVLFSHNLEDELLYLADLEEERPWFIEHNFPIELPKEDNDLELLYKQHKYSVLELLNTIEPAWKNIESKFWSALQDPMVNGYRFNIQYLCHVSHYGPEGKYRRPNRIFVRLNNTRDTDTKRVLETIAHELIHLVMAKYYEKQSLSYAQKELAVDDFIITKLAKLFPDYNKQKIG